MKKYIVESWTRHRREVDTLEEAEEIHEINELQTKGSRKDSVIIEVETTEKKL